MVQINTCRRAVILTNAHRNLRIADMGQVILQGFRMEKLLRGNGPAAMAQEPVFWISSDHTLGKRRRHRKIKPMRIGHRKGHVGSLKVFNCGDNIQNRQMGDTIWLIERHPMGNTRTTVMRHDRKPTMTEMIHKLKDVLSHCTFRIG